MKKISLIFTAAFLIFGMVGCGSASANLGDTSTTAEQSEETDTEPETSAEVQNTEVQSEVSDNSTENNDSKILVAFFSATGNTKVIAEAIAEVTGADMFEIVPVNAYNSDDLNYSDDNCRANLEQKDSSARPEILGAVEDMGFYDVVLIGHPIWWGEEPRIIDTFVESYDLSGKTIANFCTSGGSGISTAESNLKSLCPDNVNWAGSNRFANSASLDDIANWILELNFSNQ